MSTVNQEEAIDLIRKKTKNMPNGCLEVVGNKRGAFGYAGFMVDGRATYAHRIVWEYTYGTIKNGLNVLHHCDNPACVNVSHLFLGTHADNARDRDRKGRSRNKYTGRLKA